MNHARKSLRKLWLKSRSAAVALLFLLLVSASATQAATVLYTATDLADTTLGEDLWLYEYRVSDFAFGSGEGFNITFDRALYTKLQNPPPLVNADWDVLTLQPDLALSSNGIYDALALRAAPSLANDFRVTAVWLGTGTPGAQPFTIHDASFGTIATGQTAPVPEPTTAVLLLFGSWLCARRRPRTGDPGTGGL
jgi:hypothetical protein